MKRFIACFSLIIAIVLTNTCSYVLADEQPEEQITEYSVNLIYNNQNIPKESYQTLDNYNAYYDLLSGNIKNDIIFGGYVHTQYNTNQFEGFYNSINYIANNEYLDFNELSFKPIVIDNNVISFNDCIYFISMNSDTYSNYLDLYLLYSPISNDEIYISGSQICAEHIFYYSINRYTMIINDINGVYYSSYQLLSSEQAATSDTTVSVAQAPDGLLDLYHLYNFGGIILSSEPLYYTWNGQNDTVNNDYYNMGFTSPYYIYWHLMQQDDTTGFLTDRRIFVGNGNTTEDGEVLPGEVDDSLFNGKLGFKALTNKCSNNYKSDDGKYYPFIDLYYTINNYTNIRKENVVLRYKMKLDMNFYWSGSRSGEATQQQIYFDMDYQDININDYLNKYSFNTRGNSYLNLYGQKFSRGVRIANENYISSSEINNLRSLIDYAFDIYNKRLYYQYDDQYKTTFILSLSCYLFDTSTGESSDIYTTGINLYNNTFTENKESILEDDDDAYNDFRSSFDYIYDDDMDKPIKYGDYVPTIIDDKDISIVINDNPFPYILVDIPENQYIDTTPRFKDMMNDVIGAVGEDRQTSVIGLVKTEFNYLPSDAIKYITYAVGVICLVGFWRLIRK